MMTHDYRAKATAINDITITKTELEIDAAPFKPGFSRSSAVDEKSNSNVEDWSNGGSIDEDESCIGGSIDDEDDESIGGGIVKPVDEEDDEDEDIIPVEEDEDIIPLDDDDDDERDEDEDIIPDEEDEDEDIIPDEEDDDEDDGGRIWNGAPHTALVRIRNQYSHW